MIARALVYWTLYTPLLIASYVVHSPWAWVATGLVAVLSLWYVASVWRWFLANRRARRRSFDRSAS